MENTMFDYFYANENEQYQFLQTPWMLIRDDRFRDLADSSKMLYSLLLNRTSLSAKNGWRDENGRVYIIYTIEELMYDLNCYQGKVNKSLKELKECGLITTVRQGLTKPNLIYVMNFATKWKYHKKDRTPENEKEPTNPDDIMICDFSNSEIAILTKPNLLSSQTINTDNNNTDFIYMDDSKSTSSHADGDSKKADADNDFIPNHEEIKKQLQENIEYDLYIRNNRQNDIELVDELINCMLDVICTKGDTVKINGEEKSRNFVISQYMKLTAMDIDHIIYRYKEQGHKIKQLHSYLKTMLYTIGQECNHFYTNQVKVDRLNPAFGS